MLHSWMDGRMVEEHRRELMLSASAFAAASTALHRMEEGLAAPVDHRAGAGALEVAPPRARHQEDLPRRPLGHQVGALLIRAGTRLGGASMQTS